MKSTGIVRKVDELGRVVIPIELRRNMEIEVKDSLEIFTDGNTVIFKKYQPNRTCAVTGETSSENKYFLGGSLVLSKQGAQKLKEQFNNDFDL